MTIYWDLFLTFARVGVCTFGGGYAMLPILRREICTNKEWATEAELSDYFAIGQCTPGVIAVNTATFVGQKQSGTLGGICATFGVVFPSVIIITLIAAFLEQFAHIKAVGHAFGGIRACVVALIAISVLQLARTAITDRFGIAMFTGMLSLSLVGVYVTNLPIIIGFLTSPVALVLLAGVLGLLFAPSKAAAVGIIGGYTKPVKKKPMWKKPVKKKEDD